LINNIQGKHNSRASPHQFITQHMFEFDNPSCDNAAYAAQPLLFVSSSNGNDWSMKNEWGLSSGPDEQELLVWLLQQRLDEEVLVLEELRKELKEVYELRDGDEMAKQLPDEHCRDGGDDCGSVERCYCHCQ